jgi:hypothetical protein
MINWTYVAVIRGGYDNKNKNLDEHTKSGREPTGF